MSITSAKRQAYAPGTNANFKTQWKAYLLFCLYFGLHPLPSTVSTICRYIVFLCHSLSTYQSLKNYLNGVRVLHLCHDYEFILLSNFEVRLVLQYAKRHLRSAPFAKLPIEPWMLLKIRTLIDLSSSRGAALWCSLLIAFFGFLRKSNLVPTSTGSFSPARHLSRGNITRTDYGLLLSLTWTKTIQFQDRVLQVPICSLPGSALDPVFAFNHMCAITPAPIDSPAFVYASNSQLASFTHASFVSELRSLLLRIGLNPSLYGGHSFRRGGCSFAFRSQVPTELLKSHGDWRSACYLRYLDFSVDQKLLVTKLMGHALLTQL